ncbi:MAG: response regulator [Lachnospiraceae bacterium]|nr:response regulator [Lachnospiraceae bacterium]
MAKILICDDSILARSQMRDMLSNIGDFEVFEAKNGAEAIEVYKENKPDMAFLDIVMPVKNGIDVVKEIMEFDKDAKIIMASSLGNNSNLKAALEGGAIDFIQKPVDEERLREILNKNLGGR